MTTPNPTPYYMPPQPKNGLGTAAMVLGIVGVCFAFIPVAGVFIAVPLAILALIFGVIGIVRVSRAVATNKGSAVTGTVLSGVTLAVAIAMSALVFSATPTYPNGVPGNQPAAGPAPVGNGPAADIEVDNCRVASDFGAKITKAKVTVTNSTDIATQYDAEIAVRGDDGTRYGAIIILSSTLAPGESEELKGFDAEGNAHPDAPVGPAECEVMNASRY